MGRGGGGIGRRGAGGGCWVGVLMGSCVFDAFEVRGKGGGDTLFMYSSTNSDDVFICRALRQPLPQWLTLFGICFRLQAHFWQSRANPMLPAAVREPA